jgi:hypothetical protein
MVIIPHLPNLLQSGSLDLDRYALGKLVDSDACAGRLVRKPLLILGVHLCEVCHVCDEDLLYESQPNLAKCERAAKDRWK